MDIEIMDLMDLNTKLAYCENELAKISEMISIACPEIKGTKAIDKVTEIIAKFEILTHDKAQLIRDNEQSQKILAAYLHVLRQNEQ